MNTSSSKKIYNVSATLEIITGIILIIAPKFTIYYLLGEGIALVGISVTSVAGIALISLGVSALELFNQPIKKSSRIGLVIYNFGVTILFLILAIFYNMNGILIWPTIGIHFIFSLLITKSILNK